MNYALMKLTRRAERNDPETLSATFVDVGSLFTLLSSQDHQVLYGRRGTGKTHVLKYLTEINRSAGDMCVYVDMRTIGSSGGLYADHELPIAERGSRLLGDTLSHVYAALQDEVIQASYQSDRDFTAAMRNLDVLESSLTDVRVTGEEEQEVRAEATAGITSSAAAGVALANGVPGVNAALSRSSSAQIGAGVRQLRRGPLRHRVHFGSVSQSIGALVDSLPGRLWVLLDEWSDVPLDLQPLLADLLRRSLMTVNGVTVKIGAIEQRANFMQADGVGGYVGLELGADIAADLDLDDFMVFGNDASKARQFFEELMFRHVAVEIESETDRPTSASDFVRRAFTRRDAFDEFVRAAEGVPRDAINIAMTAAQIANDGLISVPIIRSAARRWYLRDKEKAVESNQDAMALLHWVIDKVIAGRRARAFLLRQDEALTAPLVNALYDARVLHVIKRGISAHDQPGVRFNVYALDYGCYVELISTAYAPIGLLPTDASAEYIEVPPDDYRSIRRAILDLAEFSQRPDDPGVAGGEADRLFD
jgi:hypothetical protein